MKFSDWALLALLCLGLATAHSIIWGGFETRQAHIRACMFEAGNTTPAQARRVGREGVTERYAEAIKGCKELAREMLI